MTFHDELRAALAGGVERGVDELAMSVGREARVVQQHLGILRQQDEVERDEAGLWRLTGRRAPKPASKPRQAPAAPPEPVDPTPAEPVPFDCCVWLDGSLTLWGVAVRDDGAVMLRPDEARLVLTFLQRALQEKVEA